MIWVAAIVGVGLLSQTADDALRVVVTDASAAVIQGAAVTVTCAGVERTAPSDASGVAVFSGLPLGECAIRVERAAFKTWRGKGVAGGGSVEARLSVEVVKDSVPVRPKSAGRRFVDWLTSCTRR